LYNLKFPQRKLGIFFALKFAGVSATDAGATELVLQESCRTKFRGGMGCTSGL